MKNWTKTVLITGMTLLCSAAFADDSAYPKSNNDQSMMSSKGLMIKPADVAKTTKHSHKPKAAPRSHSNKKSEWKKNAEHIACQSASKKAAMQQATCSMPTP